MKRISEERISNAKKGHTAVIQEHPTVYPQDIAVADAQLSADKEVLRGWIIKVEKAFPYSLMEQNGMMWDELKQQILGECDE